MRTSYIEHPTSNIEVAEAPFGGDWTEQKLDALKQYLQAYANALSKTKFQRIYIDALAGTGYREQKTAQQQPQIFPDELDRLTGAESQRFIDGSAKIALRVPRVPSFRLCRT